MTFWSCEKIADTDWDNPRDPKGESWNPPTVNIMGDAGVAVNDELLVMASASTGDTVDGSIEKYYWALDGTGFKDSTDLPHIRVLFSTPGLRTILVKVRDHNDVFSTVDTLLLNVLEYPPTVKGMDDFGVSINDTVEIFAAGRDSNGNIEKYYWALDGLTFNDSTNEGLIKTTFTDSGIHTILVKVRDDDGVYSVPDMVNITVLTSAPSVTAMENIIVCIKDSVLITAVGYDSNGKVEKYLWALNGNQYSDSTVSGAIKTLFPDSGVFTVRVKIRDEDGIYSRSDKVIITVIASPPTVQVMKDTVVSIHDTITITATGIDDNGTVVLYYWALNEGEAIDTTKAGQINTVFSDSGVYQILVKVRDDDSIFSLENSVIITVYKDAPIVDAGRDTSVRINSEITFFGSVEQNFGTIDMYKWDFNGDGLYDDSSATYDSIVHRYSHADLYRTVFYVRDDDGNESVDSIFVNVWNSAPVINAIIVDTVVNVFDTLTFMVSASDSDGVVEKYFWDFDGNGGWDSIGNDSIVKCNYDVAGTYMVILSVRDDDNMASYDSVVIYVNLGMPILFPEPDTIVSKNDTVTVLVSAVDSNDNGSIKKYVWDLGTDGWDDSTDLPEHDFSLVEGGLLPVVWGAIDDDNNISMDTFSIRFNRPPILEVTYPLNDDTIRWFEYLGQEELGTIKFICNASDLDLPDDSLVFKLYTLSEGYEFPWLDAYTGSIDELITYRIESSKTFSWELIVYDRYGDSAAATGNFVTPPKPSSFCERGFFIDDRDSMAYKCVNIGSQTWMAQNLAYLPQVDNISDGSENDENGKYYYIYFFSPFGSTENEQIQNAKEDPIYNSYGVFYNWYAAMENDSSSSSEPSGVQGVCPTGWHLPSDTEWTVIENAVGGTSVAGKKLKVAVFYGFDDDGINFNGTNEYGFSVQPVGFRFNGGTQDQFGVSGNFWTATENEYDQQYAWTKIFSSENDDVGLMYNFKNSAVSVRCIEN
ncbi:MAG: hypothetical protein HQK83_07750 [Fibrobacteria bacterium]|nr:hypothetical protein [Fibrobacteria bacterium]